MILAGIDIGTNSLRLLIAETGPDSFRELAADRRITRLGQGLDRTCMLSSDAVERSLHALAEFQVSIQKMGVQYTAAIGTSALRNAKKSLSFIATVKDRTGIVIRVVPGEEEARLSLLGVLYSLEGPRRNNHVSAHASVLVIDIGGGSTEIIITRPGRAIAVKSLPLGAVYLTERFIAQDPPTQAELTEIRRAVRLELDNVSGELEPDADSIIIGTAGTITTLATIDQGLPEYDSEKINRSVLNRNAIASLIEQFGSMTLKQRRTMRGLEQGREDIVLAGAIVAEEIMQHYHYKSMLVSDWGLREGIVLDLHEKLTNKA